MRQLEKTPLFAAGGPDVSGCRSWQKRSWSMFSYFSLPLGMVEQHFIGLIWIDLTEVEVELELK